MQTQKRRRTLTKNDQLPLIPDKLYFAIGEVAQLCQLKPHVLRYWEQEFEQLCPGKRRGNRRYYQRSEVLLVRRIRELLYEQGYTIEGARQSLVDSSQPELLSVIRVRDFICRTIDDLEKLVFDLESKSNSGRGAAW